MCWRSGGWRVYVPRRDDSRRGDSDRRRQRKRRAWKGFLGELAWCLRMSSCLRRLSFLP